MRTRPEAPAVTARGGERGERPRREACAGREAAGPRMRPAGPARASLWAPLGSFPARLGTRGRAGGGGDGREGKGGGDGPGAVRGSRGASEQNGLGAALLTSRGTRRRPLGECGGWSMGYRFLVTVRIRERADRPPRVKAFVVRFPRSSRHGSASRALAVVALVLMLRRSQRRGRPLHAGPGKKGPPEPGAQGLWFRVLSCI